MSRATEIADNIGRHWIGTPPAWCIDVIAELRRLDAEVERLAKVNVEPVATLWREENQKLYPGPILKLTREGESLPLGVLHPLATASALAAAQAEIAKLHDALEVYDAAFDEWMDKTNWLKPEPSELGMHRADVIRTRLDAAQADASRYRALRRGQKWSVINGVGESLRAETLDAEIDVALESQAGELVNEKQEQS